MRQARTQRCSEENARKRLRNAQAFADVAALVAEEVGHAEYASVSASLAVPAGIAASDTACCKALGVRARGPHHHEAAALLREVEPDGKRASAHLIRLLELKDEAQYGFIVIGAANLRGALRQASALVASPRGC